MNEVHLVIMRLLSVFMSRTKSGSKSSSEVHGAPCSDPQHCSVVQSDKTPSYTVTLGTYLLAAFRRVYSPLGCFQECTLSSWVPSGNTVLLGTFERVPPLPGCFQEEMLSTWSCC